MESYVKRMQEAIINYRDLSEQAAAKIADNNRIYRPEEAEKANKAVMSKLLAYADAARDTIEKARAEGVRNVNAWSTMDGEKITADAKLLEMDAVNPSQFRGLVEKYQSNGTMIQLLRGYAERRNKGRGGFEAAWNFDGRGGAAEHFDTSGLPSAEEKLKKVDGYAAQAVSAIDHLTDFKGGAMLNMWLENFGEN